MESSWDGNILVNLKIMIIEEFTEYAKDNPNNLWFKKRWYGWGWTPVKWQGWALVLLFLIIAIVDALYLECRIAQYPEAVAENMIIFFGVLITAFVLFMWLSYKKGEKPGWSWGDPRKKSLKDK